jgi:hypothetical protein
MLALRLPSDLVKVRSAPARVKRTFLVNRLMTSLGNRCVVRENIFRARSILAVTNLLMEVAECSMHNVDNADERASRRALAVQNGFAHRY